MFGIGVGVQLEQKKEPSMRGKTDNTHSQVPGIQRIYTTVRSFSDVGE